MPEGAAPDPPSAATPAAAPSQPRTALYLILAQRLWQGGAGLVTVVLIAHYLSLEQQGWYYGFLSLAALYTLFDLGLSQVLIQTAAHYSVELRWGERGSIRSGGARFAALLAGASRYYLGLALAFAAAIVPVGWLLFSSAAATLPDWMLQWSAIGLATAVSLAPLPFLALVEGSGAITSTYGVRLVQGIAGALATWAALLGGAGVWAALMAPLAAALVPSLWLALRRPGLMKIAASPAGTRIDWRQEIWPLQWRLGLSWLAGYLLTQMQILLLLLLRGPEEAGQMGLSLALGNMVGLVALSWVSRHVPSMGQAVAARDWIRLDQLFRRDFAISCGMFVLGAGALCVVHLLLGGTDYITRVLPFWPFCGLMAALLLTHIVGLLALHLRSFRREPLVGTVVVGGIATFALAAFGASMVGATGAIAALLVVQAAFVLPVSVVIWRRKRAHWTRT